MKNTDVMTNIKNSMKIINYVIRTHVNKWLNTRHPILLSSFACGIGSACGAGLYTNSLVIWEYGLLIGLAWFFVIGLTWYIEQLMTLSTQNFNQKHKIYVNKVRNK